MVASIVHSAVARKMLCNPVNSLIADTEFCCAAGMLMRIQGAGQTEGAAASGQKTVADLYDWLMRHDMTEPSQEFDIPIQNLMAMVKNYHAGTVPLDGRLRELFALGLEKEIPYPKGRFL